MYSCCGCGAQFEGETPGLMIRPVAADISPKSGRIVPQDDRFPDGSVEKFLCIGCVLENQHLGILLGFYGQGFDQPPEGESSEPTALMYRMPAAYLPWPEGS